MLHLHRILGRASAPEFQERLHSLGHDGAVEYIDLAPKDLARRRLRVETDRGTLCGIALSRDQALENGSLLLLEADRAIVVRMAAQAWLGLAPRDDAAALELGYHAGNLHWRVRFDGARLWVALDGPEADYLARLEPLLAADRVTPVPAS